MTDSLTLLAEYARSGSESAFRELVSRYIDLVYSTAFRLVGGDAQSAQDVAQTVFVALAAKAGTLPQDVMLGGWLHQHTRFAAGKFMRTERRRQLRERQAAEMNAIEDHSESNLAQVAPVLDEAIGQLEAEDRTAILLRFFERKDFLGVGDALGSSEDAARKRVDRALEKLHVLLTRRGAALSAAALGTALASEAVAAAPAGLAASVAGAALASAVASGGITATLVKLMTMTKLKVGIISVIAVAGVATPLAIQNQSQARLREENEALRRQAGQLAQVTAENGRLSNLLAQATSVRTLAQDQSRELLKLRGEVGVLRRQSNYLAGLEEENRLLRPQAHAQIVAESAAARPPEEEARYVCVNNIRVIENAIQMCALEEKISADDGKVTSQQILSYLAALGMTNGLPRCPSGGTYQIGRVADSPTCSVPGHALVRQLNDATTLPSQPRHLGRAVPEPQH